MRVKARVLSELGDSNLEEVATDTEALLLGPDCVALVRAVTESLFQDDRRPREDHLEINDLDIGSSKERCLSAILPSVTILASNSLLSGVGLTSMAKYAPLLQGFTEGLVNELFTTTSIVRNTFTSYYQVLMKLVIEALSDGPALFVAVSAHAKAAFDILAFSWLGAIISLYPFRKLLTYIKQSKEDTTTRLLSFSLFGPTGTKGITLSCGYRSYGSSLEDTYILSLVSNVLHSDHCWRYQGSLKLPVSKPYSYINIQRFH